jgi:hypothetical protein
MADFTEFDSIPGSTITSGDAQFDQAFQDSLPQNQPGASCSQTPGCNVTIQTSPSSLYDDPNTNLNAINPTLPPTGPGTGQTAAGVTGGSAATDSGCSWTIFGLCLTRVFVVILGVILVGIGVVMFGKGEVEEAGGVLHV